MRLRATRAVPSAIPNWPHQRTSSAGRQPGRVRAEQQAGDDRPGGERPVEQRFRGPALRVCCICSETVTSGRGRIDDRRHHAPGRGAARRARPVRPGHERGTAGAGVARGAAAHPVVAQRRHRRVPLRADAGGADGRRAVGRVHVARRAGLGRRVPADRPGARAVRHPRPRSRAPAAVREPAGERLRRCGICSPTRASCRSTSTGAATWRTTGRSSGRTSPTSRSTGATRSGGTRSGASSPATRSASPGGSC